MNNNGYPELIFLGYDQTVAKRYESNGTPTATELSSIITVPSKGYELAFIDNDNDGDYDVYGAYNNVDGKYNTELYYQENSGTKENPIFSNDNRKALKFDNDKRFLVFNFIDITASDVDNDGDNDLLVSRSKEVRLYENLGENIFSSAFITIIPYGDIINNICEFADLNNDGVDDIICCNGQSNAATLSVFWGKMSVSINSPGNSLLSHTEKIRIMNNHLILHKSVSKKTSLNVYDLRGKRLTSINSLTTSTNLNELGLSIGLYVARVISKNGVSLFNNLVSIK